MAWDSQAEELRDRAIWWAGGIVIAGVIGIGAYYKFYAKGPQPLQQKTEVPQLQQPHQLEDEDVVQHPVPQQTPDAGLPDLNGSDQLVHDSLAGLFQASLVEQLLNPENIVRHIVATVDNLPRKKVAVEVRPVKATPGLALVQRHDNTIVLSEKNYARYNAFFKALDAADAKQIAAVYFRLYPLFQQAYEDLGYPGKYFNDRLVHTIDDMLQAPDVRGPIKLTQPKVFYELADPQLEERSAGQKLLMRMGPDHERAIKEKLQALRAEIVNNDAVKGK
jgi:hypothetical protein